MFDKLLLILMLLLLPVSALLTRHYLQKSAHPTVTVESIEKVDEMLDKLQQEIAGKQETVKMPELMITSFFYATQSATMMVSGVAPKGNLSVRVSALEVEKKTKEKTSSESAVLGDKISEVAIETSSDGVFGYQYKIEDKSLDKMELRFEQGQASKTVVYNFVKGTFEQI